MNFKDWMTKVNKSNAAFSKANKARKRVMIAKDVIEALEAQLINGEGGAYVSFESRSGGMKEEDKIFNAFYDSSGPNKDVRDLLIENNPACTVCAKGAIFTCTVMRRDQVRKDVLDKIRWKEGNSLSNSLGGLFTNSQLNSIENHFEIFFGTFEKGTSAFEKYPHGKERMIAIMKNIIKHGGTFKPELEGK